MLNKIIKFDELISMESLNEDIGNINISIDKIDKINISKRLDLIKLDTLEININYNKVNKIELVAKYDIIAIGDQECVITLNPIKFNIKEFFNMKFKNIKNIDLSSLEDEFIEPIYNNNINFSEIGVQMFASFLSPYPKINNGKIDLKSILKDDVNNEENNNNPFEVLNNINK